MSFIDWFFGPLPEEEPDDDDDEDYEIEDLKEDIHSNVEALVGDKGEEPVFTRDEVDEWNEEEASDEDEKE